MTMLVLYFVQRDPEVLIKYPSPQQPLSDVYVDDDGVCYRYKRQEIEKNEHNLKKQTVL
jgi:hypothetical protein